MWKKKLWKPFRSTVRPTLLRISALIRIIMQMPIISKELSSSSKVINRNSCRLTLMMWVNFTIETMIGTFHSKKQDILLTMNRKFGGNMLTIY